MNKTLLVSLILTLFVASGCTTKIGQTRLEGRDLIQANYPAESAPNNLSFAYAEPEFTIEADISNEMQDGLGERLSYLANNLSCHLYGELDKVILSKGFTITDRFPSIRYMTFTEKRNTSALFYPEVKIRITEKSDITRKGGLKFETAGVLEIDAEVNIIMLEPMSNEIIWIKSIPVDDVRQSFEYENAFWAGYDGGRLMRNREQFEVGRGSQFAVPSNLAQIGQLIDDVFFEIDQKIIEATIRFVDAEEFAFLNRDIKTLKEIKRY